MEINRYLDHAVLKPDMTREEVTKAIQLGIDYSVRTVCVRPCDIDLAMQLCRGSETEVSCTVGFPHGVVPPAVKAEEARLYIAQGVREIDMVANFSHIKSGLWELVEQDIVLTARETNKAGILLKVIVESALLTPEELKKVTEICISAGANFVKTSTGFNGEGATKEAVEAMVRVAANRIQVKASGGVRDRKTAEMYIALGCTRLGNGYQSTPAICDGLDSARQEGCY